MYTFDLTGKVALVTGGAEGLGQEFVTTLAEQGADVAIFDIQYVLAQATAEEVAKKTGKKIKAWDCQVAVEEQVVKCVAEVVEEFGKIDILVNNAGVLTYAKFEELSFQQWQKVIDTDLTGTWLVTRETAKQAMMKQKKGRVINIASIAAYLASPAGCPSYHAAKAGVVGLTKAQAAELAPYNILVNAIAPGTFLNGGMTARSAVASNPETHKKGRNPLKRAGVYGELSGALIYFASDECSYTNAQILSIDGGISAML